MICYGLLHFEIPIYPDLILYILCVPNTTNIYIRNELNFILILASEQI